MDVLWPFGIVYDHWVHFVFIWYIFPVLVSWTNKNLATLMIITGANPTMASYDASAVKIYNATSAL
jgi:hypothetical protein